MPKYNVAVPVRYTTTNYYTIEAESEEQAEMMVHAGKWDTRDIGEVDYDDGIEYGWNSRSGRAEAEEV